MQERNTELRGTDALVQLGQNYIEQGWQEGDTEALGQLLAPNFINHGTAGGGETREEFLDGIRELYAAFPDFEATIEDMVVDRESKRVAIRWVGTGTHRGTLGKLPPSGRQATFKGIDIVRVRDDRIIERWGESNAAQVLSELAPDDNVQGGGNDGQRK